MIVQVHGHGVCQVRSQPGGVAPGSFLLAASPGELLELFVHARQAQMRHDYPAYRHSNS
jgi:hypothetical protein